MMPFNFPSPAFSRPIFEGRLHPLTLLFGLVKGLRRAFPIILLFFFGNRWMFVVVLMALAGTILTACVHYFSFSYRIEGNELITQQGILERRQRNIPLERIQEIRIEQGIMHRIFGVVDAKIETGSGKGAEASLSVLSRNEAERLRQAVFERLTAIKGGKSASVADANITAPERVVIRRLGVKDLVVAGLTSNHLVSALVLAGALWNFADDIFPENIYRRAADFIYKMSKVLIAKGAATTLLITLTGLLLIFIIGLIFSIIGSVIIFYGFTLSRRGEDLHRSYGLLTHRASSLPRRRIQVLEVEEKMLRRLFGLATLRADTAGSHREHEDDNEGRDVLIPIVRRSEVDELLPVVFPDLNSDGGDWQRVSKLAVRRGTIKGSLVCFVSAIVLIILHRELLALYFLVFIPLVYLINVVNYRNLGYMMGERYFRTRHGWLGRSTHIVPVNKIQAIEIHQSPFDRRLDLATLSIDTAGQAYTGRGPRISNVPIGEAKAIAEMLAHKAAVTFYRW